MKTNCKGTNAKRIALILLFTGFGFLSNAQTQKGNLLLGAGTSFSVGEANGYMSLGFNSSSYVLSDGTTVDVKSSIIYFAPKFGYFFADNFAAGFDVATAFSRGETTQSGVTSKNKANQFLIGPFARYYFSGEKIKPFLEANSLFGVRNQETQSSTTTTSENKYSTTNIGGGVGIAILFGEKSALDLLASYNSFTNNEKDNNFSSKINNISIKLGFTLFLR